jgi:glutamine synthetase
MLLLTYRIGKTKINEFNFVILTEESTLNITCDIIESNDMKGYEKDPRSIAKRAEDYLNETGIGDTASQH